MTTFSKSFHNIFPAVMPWPKRVTSIVFKMMGNTYCSYRNVQFVLSTAFNPMNQSKQISNSETVCCDIGVKGV